LVPTIAINKTEIDRPVVEEPRCLCGHHPQWGNDIGQAGQRHIVQE